MAPPKARLPHSFRGGVNGGEIEMAKVLVPYTNYFAQTIPAYGRGRIVTCNHGH
jgi:hypothetical protein